MDRWVSFLDKKVVVSQRKASQMVPQRRLPQRRESKTQVVCFPSLGPLFHHETITHIRSICPDILPADSKLSTRSLCGHPHVFVASRFGCY